MKKQILSVVSSGTNLVNSVQNSLVLMVKRVGQTIRQPKEPKGTKSGR